MRETDTHHGILPETLGLGETFVTYTFPATFLDRTPQCLWMVTPYPGPTSMFLEQIPALQKEGYSVHLSLENTESIAMVTRKFPETVPVTSGTLIRTPEILFISAVETEHFSLSVIDAFRKMNPRGRVIFQEDTAGSMRPLMKYVHENGGGFVPEIILTPTKHKADEYRVLFDGRNVTVESTGNPDLDVLPHEHAPTPDRITEIKKSLGIPPESLVFYLVGKAAQYMELPDYIHLPEHQDLSGILSGRRDINSFFMQYSLKAIERFRIRHAEKIGNRPVHVLYRPHPKDRENDPVSVHMFDTWFSQEFPESDIRVHSYTTGQWNMLLKPDEMYYISDVVVFFDSTLINRVVLDIVAQYKKLHIPFENQLPKIAYPVIFHPWASLCVPFFTKKVDHERMFVTSYTTHWEDLVDDYFPSAVFSRKDAEMNALPLMSKLARQYMKLDESGVWQDIPASLRVAEAIKNTILHELSFLGE